MMFIRSKKSLVVLGICIVALGFAFAGCGSSEEASVETEPSASVETEPSSETVPATQEEEVKDPRLLYMGHASLRIVTGEDKVIYIDPYAGDAYDLPADLILVTHDHYDHNAVDLIKNRNDDCRIITQKEALADHTFDLGYVTVEATEAGNNQYHSNDECVGYILTFSDGKSLYVTGDTSTTDQMSELAERNIDYAFFCCDGVYNMDLEEAAKCAQLVQAKHNIPYHIVEAENPEHFDKERADQFDAPNKMVLEPGGEITL